jgi:hypothetical protein
MHCESLVSEDWIAEHLGISKSEVSKLGLYYVTTKDGKTYYDSRSITLYKLREMLTEAEAWTEDRQWSESDTEELKQLIAEGVTAGWLEKEEGEKFASLIQ